MTFVYVSGRRCLDFVGTLKWRQSARQELLTDPELLSDWAVQAGMLDAGIGCGRYFAPIHLQPSYAAWRDLGNLAVTEAEAKRTLALPFFNNLKIEAIDEVCDVLEELLKTGY